MKLIVLECKGRLANLILCWANARHVLGELGIQDSWIILNYDLPPETVKFPGASIFRYDIDKEKLPRVTREQLAEQTGDVLWIWQDIYSNFPPAERMAEIIRTIEVHPKLEAELAATISAPTLGVHVRHGDFGTYEGGEVFQRAPNEFYLDRISAYGRICAEPARRIFLASDGEDKDLEFITCLPMEVIRGRKDNPIFDLLALSRCQTIIGSNSTFSAVAAYLGNVPLVTP